jgi:hypothetical protein
VISAPILFDSGCDLTILNVTLIMSVELDRKGNWGSQRSEAMWKNEDGVSTPPAPTMAVYTEAMNKFRQSATAFMEHVHLLTEARTAYHEAIAAGTVLRNRLDAGEQALRSLMTQLEQVVDVHSGEPALDKKKPEAVKADAIRTNVLL